VLNANDDQNKISLIASLEGYSGAFSFCGTRKTFLPINSENSECITQEVADLLPTCRIVSRSNILTNYRML